MPNLESGSSEPCTSTPQSPVSNPQSRIHVVAGVLQDARGRVLLARREGQRELAGLWEFPGGKVEPGERPVQALGRELHEEIGIEIDPDSASPLIAVPHRMASGKRIVLDVYRIGRFAGRARGMEAQALAWVAPERLGSYSMPAADRPVVGVLTAPERYLITPAPASEASLEDFLARLEQALEGGIRRLQLRAPGWAPEAFVRCAAAAAQCARRHGAELLLNSGNLGLEHSLHLAWELGTGLHLTAADLARVRQRPLGPGQLCAASCHDAGELQQAEALALDFAVLGPVQPTATHPQARPLGLDGFARLRECVSLPLYALGGMQPADLVPVRAHGAQGVAGIRAFWPQA